MVLSMDTVSQIEQRRAVIEHMQLDRYEQALKKLVQQADVQPYHRRQEGIGRGREVQHAKEDACREEAPSSLNHPAEEQFLGKTGPERN